MTRANVHERVQDPSHDRVPSVKGDPDTLLMERFVRGDDQAFDELFNRNAERACRIAMRFGLSADDASDIAQEAFLRVFSARERWKSTAKFSTWLYTIVARLCFNLSRKAKGVKVIPVDSSAELPAAEAGGPKGALLRKELAAAVREAVHSLPPNQRMAVILHRFEGLSYKEIACVLECSLSAVESLLHRAKKSLKQKLRSWVRQ